MKLCLGKCRTIKPLDDYFVKEYRRDGTKIHDTLCKLCRDGVILKKAEKAERTMEACIDDPWLALAIQAKTNKAYARAQAMYMRHKIQTGAVSPSYLAIARRTIAQFDARAK